MNITLSDIRDYQNKRNGLKTIGEFKALGRELRDKFGLTDMEAINILNGENNKILEILERQENKKEE